MIFGWTDLPGSACLGNGDTSSQETGERFGTEGKLQQCLWEWGASSMAEGSRDEEETPSRASAMHSDSLGLGELEGLQVTVECRHQTGWFYRDVSLFTAVLGDGGQQILYPVTLNATATHHQNPSSTLSLFSVKKFQLISTQYLFHAHYLPDNVQESMRMQNKTDKLPPLGTPVILEWHDPWNVWRKIEDRI